MNTKSIRSFFRQDRVLPMRKMKGRAEQFKVLSVEPRSSKAILVTPTEATFSVRKGAFLGPLGRVVRIDYKNEIVHTSSGHIIR